MHVAVSKNGNSMAASPEAESRCFRAKFYASGLTCAHRSQVTRRLRVASSNRYSL